MVINSAINLAHAFMIRNCRLKGRKDFFFFLNVHFMLKGSMETGIISAEKYTQLL